MTQLRFPPRAAVYGVEGSGRALRGRVRVRDRRAVPDCVLRPLLDTLVVTASGPDGRTGAIGYEDGRGYVDALPLALRGSYCWAESEPSARERVITFWEDVTAQWLAGKDPLPDPLARWWHSYAGSGRGEPTREAIAEPYSGPLGGTPRIAVCALNPGEPFADWQARDGIFARQIRELGSYERWALTDPAGSSEWKAYHGRANRFRSQQLRFVRDWLDDPSAQPRDVLAFELFPWHSIAVTAPITPPPDIVNEFIWEPLAEHALDVVFAFGKPWVSIADRLALPRVAEFMPGGGHFASVSRGAVVFGLPSGQHLVVGWHQGGAGPPGTEDTRRLRRLLEELI